MTRLYHRGHRALQEAFDTLPLADRLEAVKVTAELSPADQEFVAARDMVFLATADSEGRPNCSYKGGDPGFVRVVDPGTLAFPCYDGNGMFLSMGNTLVNPHVGLLFIDFEGQRRLRVNGTASVDPTDPLVVEFPGAQFVVRIRIREVFPNCPRYLHHYQLVKRSAFLPHAGGESPVPTRKRAEWAVGVLPAGGAAPPEPPTSS